MKQVFCAFWMLGSIGLSAVMTPAVAYSQPAPGTAQGELKVNGQTFPLRFAYAQEQVNDAADSSKQQGKGNSTIALVLTDTALSLETAGSASRRAALTRAGKLNGIEIQLDATGKMRKGTLYYTQAVGKQAGNFLSFTPGPAGFSDTYVFKNLKIGSDSISGGALMTRTEQNPGRGKTEIIYQYHAQFQAAVAHPPPVTATLTGAAARNSPQAQATFAFYAAIRKGDWEAAKLRMTPHGQQDIEEAIAENGRQKTLDLMQALVASQNKLLNTLQRVVIRGDQATVVYNNNGFIIGQFLRNVNNAWLLDVQ